MLRLDGNRLTLSLDASGDHLHRRGYRIAVTPAPIRETLAAAILRFATNTGTEPLVDPMCGSGTFPIEAAWIAGDMPPGAARAFAFQRWPSYRPATWDWLRRRAIEAGRPPGSPLVASDRDPSAIQAARANAARAGAEAHIAFLERDFRDLDPRDLPGGQTPPGLLVINPPYGLRLEPGTDPASMFRDVGRRLASVWRGWRFALVLPDERLLPALGLPVEETLRLPHGGLVVTVARGRVP
jgi:putative N6-adenine-specific DNA methylase